MPLATMSIGEDPEWLMIAPALLWSPFGTPLTISQVQLSSSSSDGKLNAVIDGFDPKLNLCVPASGGQPEGLLVSRVLMEWLSR